MIHPTETLRTVAEHLAKQGKRAMRGSMCTYLAPDGSKCAVGVLLSDEIAEIAETAPEPGVEELFGDDRPVGDEFDEVRAAMAQHDVNLLKALQAVHDYRVGATRPAQLRAWRDAGAQVAERFGVAPEVWTEPFDRALSELEARE